MCVSVVMLFILFFYSKLTVCDVADEPRSRRGQLLCHCAAIPLVVEVDRLEARIVKLAGGVRVVAGVTAKLLSEHDILFVFGDPHCGRSPLICSTVTVFESADHIDSPRYAGFQPLRNHSSIARACVRYP